MPLVTSAGASMPSALQKLWYLDLWHFFLEASDAHALRLPLHFFLWWLQEHVPLFAAFLHSLRLLMAAQNPSFWDCWAASLRSYLENLPSGLDRSATTLPSSGDRSATTLPSNAG